MTRVFALLFVLGFVALFFASSSDPLDSSAPSPVASGDPVVIGEGPPEANPAKPGPASPELIGLLDGLKVGDEFDGFRVVAFYPTELGVHWVGLDRGGSLFAVGIWGKGKSKKPLPIQTELYEIGYGMRMPPEPYVAEAEMRRAAELLAARVRKRETGVAKPAGL